MAAIAIGWKNRWSCWASGWRLSPSWGICRLLSPLVPPIGCAPSRPSSLLWLLLLVLSGAILPISAYAGRSTSPADVEFESDVRLHGYRLENNQRHLHLFISAGRWDFFGQPAEPGWAIPCNSLIKSLASSVLGHDAYSHQPLLFARSRLRASLSAMAGHGAD